MTRRLSLALAALLCFAPPAFAWGALGHRLVGAIAQRHLTPATQAEVDRLLKGEADPTLAGVATWADTLRDEDPARFKATGPWHYVKTEPGTCRVEAAECPDGNCVTAAIERQLAIVGDAGQPMPRRREALKFVVHFVGDVHQPFHANSHDDAGGNGYQISLRTPIEPEAYARTRYVDGVMGTNLHSIWDYYELASRGLDLEHYADALARRPWPPSPSTLSAAPAWAGESCRLVESRHLYPPGHKLDHAYLDANRPLAEQRVLQAAFRLAEVLNRTLDPASAR